VVGRARRSAVITDRDRRITAWHEAGHAVAALVQPHAEDPVSITIVPRGEAGGVTWMGGNDNSFLTRSEASARLVVAMAGRAAEEVHLDGDFTQGAANDFAAATNLALAMVTEYGMSDLGVTYRSGANQPPGMMDEQVTGAVNGLLERALATAREIVATHHQLVAALVAELLVEETVSGLALAALASRLGALPELVAAPPA
jgi:cell division protease FtsH